MLHILLLLIAAFFAGALNSVAGGGSFLTLPALVFVGLPDKLANMTSTVALLPGSFASVYSYRNAWGQLEGISLRAMLIISVIGGAAGAILLLVTPEKLFDVIVPWLLIFATLMFAFGKRLGDALKRYVRVGFVALAVSQFVIAIYGGYFGGGIGILMLAAFAVFGMTKIHAMNGLKSLLSGCLNAVAVVVFVTKGEVYWREALIMMLAAIAGGYFGAQSAQKLPTRAIRAFVICTGVAMTAYFFWQAYGHAA
jgi:uncharacterized protein